MSNEEYIDTKEVAEYYPPNKNMKTVEKELTDKQKAFLICLGSTAKGNVREAMNQAGYAPTTPIKDIITPLAEEIKKVAENLLSANSVKAVFGLTDVFDNPAKPGSNNVIAAAKELLDRVGMSKKNENSGPQIKADNIFILPAKDKPIDIRIGSD